MVSECAQTGRVPSTLISLACWPGGEGGGGKNRHWSCDVDAQLLSTARLGANGISRFGPTTRITQRAYCSEHYKLLRLHMYLADGPGLQAVLVAPVRRVERLRKETRMSTALVYNKLFQNPLKLPESIQVLQKKTVVTSKKENTKHINLFDSCTK